MDFISDPGWMSLKQKVIRHIGNVLNNLGAQLLHEHYPGITTGCKVTRGENYLDMPYVVLDVPRLKANDLPGKLRIMFWWGHYISLQYFIEADTLSAAAPGAVSGRGYAVLADGNLFNNNLDHEDFKPLQAGYPVSSSLPVTKICARVPFGKMEELEDQVRHFMGDMRMLIPAAGQ